MTLNIRKWGAKKNALNKEVKKLEHKIAEVLKANDKHNAKLKTIKSICDEIIVAIYLAMFLLDYLKFVMQVMLNCQKVV
jgi:uncharacterized coiled-coil DUF342 family protein